MRNERWNTNNEIKRYFKTADTSGSGSGPVVFLDNGQKLVDDSEAHIAVIGKTGSGKSQAGSLPFLREILNHNESAVVVDPKAELYHRCSCFVPDEYQLFCLDFESPRHSPTQWCPLLDAYHLFKSDDPDDHDIASAIISEFWDAIYPLDTTREAFWPCSARNYMRGLTYGLFETAPEEYINLASLAAMLQQSETRYATGTVLKAFYDTLPSDSLARRNLSTYVSAPNDTRHSIHATAEADFEVFSRSKGLMQLLANDTLNIRKLDLNRPFIIFCLIPDYNDVYSSLAGILVSQIAQHLIRSAQEMRNQKLAIRCNFILEELGSVGKSIPALPSLMVAGRSRNLRLMLILQSPTQLIDIYGKSKAETILSCIGLTIGFPTNSWETLTEWSHRCGEREIEVNGHTKKEVLITPTQLAAMPAGTALILTNRFKFISKLGFYYELYDNSQWIPPKAFSQTNIDSVKALDFPAFVADRKRKAVMGPSYSSNEGVDQYKNVAFLPKPTPSIDIDAMIKDISEKLTTLEAEEKKSHKVAKTLYKVIILDDRGNTIKVAHAIANSTNLPHTSALKALEKLPFELSFHSQKQAEDALRNILAAGALATISECHFSE